MVCVCLVCVCMYAYIYICMCVYICMYVCMYVYLYVCVFRIDIGEALLTHMFTCFLTFFFGPEIWQSQVSAG